MFTATAMEDPADPDDPDGPGSGRGVDVAVLTREQFEHVFTTNKVAGTNPEFVKKAEEMLAQELAYLVVRQMRTQEATAARDEQKTDQR